MRLLDLTPSELQRCATDTDGHLVPRLRTLKASLAIFIDGTNEYFNKHVEEVPTNPAADRAQGVLQAAIPGLGLTWCTPADTARNAAQAAARRAAGGDVFPARWLSRL